jgi:putative ABC transport system substrate-binding protein
VNKRRKLLIALGAGSLAAPLCSIAQPQGKLWRIGILYPGLQSDSNDVGALFLRGLRDLGHVEGGNFLVDWRFANGKNESLSVLAADLVKQNVDIIVTEGTPAVRAAQAVTTITPIVAASFVDPVSNGFATSLAHPGSNITGLANLAEEIGAKRLEILMGVVPKVTRIAWLVNPNNTASMRLTATMEKTGQ